MDEPTTRTLIELLKERKLTVDGFLDILEARLESNPELVTQEDLYDLWRSDRLSDEEYVEIEKSWDDGVGDLPEDPDSLYDVYDQQPGQRVS